MLSYLIPFALALAACFGIQTLALRVVGGKTNKSESNFFSSLARIQAGIRDHPEVMLLGSSITGRLPDRTGGFEGVANLGCDGGSAVDTLRALGRGVLPSAPILVIEGNTLYRSVGGHQSEIAKAMSAPWFQVGRRVFNLGATARPSAFAYSQLLAGKLGKTPGMDGPTLPIKTKPAIATLATALSADGEVLVAEMAEVCERLKARRISLVLVMLPSEADSTLVGRQIPMALSRAAGVPFWDLTADLPANAVKFTDGVHMDPASAAATLRTILSKMKGQGY